VEKTYESLAPTFEKLAKFNEIKTAQKNRRAFMKSTKSFRAKATINQEYSQKILDLEKSVRHIERMNEKKVRLHKAPVLQSVHRINSMKKDSSPNLLSQRSSFVDELKREEPKEMVTPEKVVLVPPKPVAVAVAAVAPAVASPAPVPPVPKKPKQIKHVDNPLRPPEKEEVTLRKVDEAALALAKAAQTTAAAQSTQEMLQAKDNLRSTTIEASAVEPSQVPTATEFQQVQLNRTEKDDAATKKASSTEDAAQRREALLEMAKTSLRHLETPVEEVKEPPEEPAAMQVQLRKVEIVAPVVEKDTENDKNVLAVTKESLRKVASRDDDVASSAAVEIVLSTSQAAVDANDDDDDDADVGVDASALLENMEEDEVSSSVKVETPAAAPPSYAESTGSEKAPGASGRSLLGRSNSENSRQSAAQFPSQPVSHASSFYKASAVRSNAAAYDDNDVASVTSTLSSHTSTPPPPQQQQQQPPKDVSHSSSAADMSTPQRTASLDIEHLKDSLRPTPMRDASLRNNNNSNSSNNNDTEDVDAVPIMRMKEHLNPVVINQDKTREEDSNGWAAPILQAKETLRPISVREKELHVKDPAAFATSETIVETQTSDAAQSPNVVKEATPPPATEFERKASVFGKLVRKVSGIMNQATAAALSPAYAERMQQNQTGGGGGGGGGADGGGAALFELAMHADAQAAEEDHSASRNKIRDPSYDPTNKHHDHDDDIDDDLAIVHDDDFLGDLSFSRPVGFAASTGNSNSNSNSNKNPSTPSRSATKSGSDVQVVSLTKANLERTLSLRAESADSNGPGVSFRGSFSNGHKKLSFADEPSTPATTAAATAAAATTTPMTAMSPAQASRVTTTVALTPEALERHKANTSPTPPVETHDQQQQPQQQQQQQQQLEQQHQLENASQISGSETESVIKKKKSGMNFMKGLRKRTSSIFGSKSGSQFEINTTNMETASNVSAASTPVAAAAALTPTQRQISDTGSVSDAGFDDSASQTDNNNKQLRKKSGGFSSFMRSTSSVFRRSKSGNVYGNTGTAAANDGVIPEDEEMDFSETLSPTGAQSVSQQNVFAVEENDADETGSQMTANSEQKKKRLSMKGLMKRTSSLFKK
jgi:hypothetical protein